jgi:hypothetical protein
MKKRSSESSADTIISDLHQIREEIVDSFGGDLRRLTDDARRRQEASGERIWRRTELSYQERKSVCSGR